jgi:hypothetical protein
MIEHRSRKTKHLVVRLTNPLDKTLNKNNEQNVEQYKTINKTINMENIA